MQLRAVDRNGSLVELPVGEAEAQEARDIPARINLFFKDQPLRGLAEVSVAQGLALKLLRQPEGNIRRDRRYSRVLPGHRPPLRGVAVVFVELEHAVMLLRQ